ncbi:TPA: Ldh family oxidoreductase [Candidatus Poribacteria bacterium]|nr:Ldh family oxidoreductase [Candidatus Poribacteria bacterium]
MLLSVNEARQLASSFLERGGIPDAEAGIITDILLEAELRGRKTHGFIRLAAIKNSYARKEKRPITIAKESGHWMLIDGGDNPGYLVAHYAMNAAIRKAKAYGSSLVGVYNSSHCGMMGYYANMAPEADCIGIVVADCLPRITAWGGVGPILGTNPLAVGIPTNSVPIVLDMSTASITNGDLLVAMREGKSIKDGLAFDSEGNPTTDPSRALKGSVLPFGGHKGYGLALVIQILSGALVNAAVIPPPGVNYGLFLIVIDPEIFLPLDEFKQKVTDLIETTKNTKKMSGVVEILVPGERAFREREQRMEKGIEFEDDLIEQLQTP